MFPKIGDPNIVLQLVGSKKAGHETLSLAHGIATMTMLDALLGGSWVVIRWGYKSPK